MRGSVASARLAALLLGVAFAMPAAAQSGRLLVASAVTERADHLDLAIEFGCAMIYRTHTPAAEGDHVRVTLALGNDCPVPASAQFPAERLLPADAYSLVRGITLEPGLAGGAELRVDWNRIEKFVLAPTSGMRGVRIRVQRRAAAQVTVDELVDPTADYAVNLESSQVPFDDAALARAQSLLQVPVYVSTTEVAGVRWYRLRAGPFATRREAGEILRMALSRFPSAWIGIGDEPATAPEESAARPPAPAGRTPETRADAALDRQLDAARVALGERRFEAAASSLTQIVAAEDYLHRRDAAELLGLARERAGQLAQAKAIYEDYLRRYPESPATARIRERLQALRLTDIPGRAGTRAGDARLGWSAWGNASQLYRRDDTHSTGGGTSRDIVTQNAVLTDLDGLLRRRGERFDFTARTSFGYMKDLQPAGRENRLRVSSFFAELGDREHAASGRIGRQSRGMAGVNGLFDGVLGTWQAKPRLGASMVIGSPVENTRRGPDLDRLFVGSALDFASPGQHWEGSVFALAQQYSGRTDRRSLGIEARYLRPGSTLVAMTDYDVHFGQLNGAMLLGTLLTATRWTFNIDASLQRSPQLGIRNALIGQPTLAFADLDAQFNGAEIRQLALDRSAKATQLSATASHPLGDRAQWTLNLASFGLSGTPASGGVSEVPSPGRDTSLSSEVLVNGLFHAGDTHSLALRIQQGDSADLLSAGIGSRIALGTGWRLTSRLRIDRRDTAVDDSRTWIWSPSLRLEYARSGSSFELEAGMELNRRQAADGGDRANRRFISAGYRLFLDRAR